jgi:ribosome-associated translation inhibitor RaiA
MEKAMTLPLQITFRNVESSSMVEDWIRNEAAKLETFYNRITACRVAVEIPHRHHRKGKQCHVRIDLTLPGKELVVKREPAPSSRSRRTRAALAGIVKKMEPHHDLRLVIHDAFKAAGRCVQDYARLHRGKVKNHRPSIVLVN